MSIHVQHCQQYKFMFKNAVEKDVLITCYFHKRSVISSHHGQTFPKFTTLKFLFGGAPNNSKNNSNKLLKINKRDSEQTIPVVFVLRKILDKNE